MIEGIGFLFSGMVFGLAAGISPGPLIALVFSETIKYGKKEGFKIAFAPLITDLPIILFVLLILSRLTKYDLVLGIITLFGAVYLIYLGVEIEVKLEKKGALKRGIIANFLSPHPYLFWLFIGGPMILKSLNIHVFATILFILGFYSLLVGSKICITLILDKFKSFTKNKYYIYIIRALGITLILFALIFLNRV